MNRVTIILLKHLRGELNEAETAELQEWLAADEGNRKLLDELEDADQVAAALAKWEQVDEARGWERMLQYKNPAPVIPLYHRRWLRWAAAAVFISLLAGGAYLWLNKPSQPTITAKLDIPPGHSGAVLTLAGKTIVLDTAQNGKLMVHAATDITKADSSITVTGNTVEYAVLTTPRGRKEQLTLADGTTVWLNAASSIRFPTAFKGNSRTVEITGEVYFEVVHNTKQPFHVKVKGLDIEDVGTHFNINAYDDEPSVKTTLLEGAVKLGMLILQPGQQAELNNSGKLQLNKDIDIEQVMAWKNGLFRFNGTNITAIMRQVSRWYDVDIEYKGDVSQLDFSGYVGRKENVSKVLAILEATGTIHFTIEDKKIIVSP